jgi:hypothetical protein
MKTTVNRVRDERGMMRTITTVAPKTILQHDQVGHTDEATKELRQHLPDLKLSPKPTRLMKHLISIANVGKDDVVLDCYAGTGALGEAVFSLEVEGRPAPSFILIEFPEKLDGSDLTLSGAMVQRLTSNAKRASNAHFGFRTFKLGRSNFRRWTAISTRMKTCSVGSRVMWGT